MRIVSTVLVIIAILTGCTPRLIKFNNNQPPASPISMVDDVNNDGVLSPVEIELAMDQTEPLSVFIWLVVAVMGTVVITMIFSKLKEKKQPKTVSNTPSPIYQSKTPKKQDNVIRG